MRKRLIIALGLILALFLSGGCGSKSAKTANSAEEKYTSVELESVVQHNLTEATTLSGKVIPDKDITVLPKVQIPTKVTAVKVKVGDKVSAGDTLVILSSEDVQKQVDTAGAGLQMAQANYDRTKEQMDLAKANLERQRKLYDAGAISKVQLEQAEVAASDSNLSPAEAQLTQAKVMYQQAQDALNNLKITSPINGVISSVNTDVGAVASAAVPVATVADISSVHVLVNITENIVNNLAKDQAAEVSVSAAAEQPFAGKIDYVSPNSDPRNQLYAVKISMPNPEGLIKPGMFAKVKLTTKQKNSVLAVKSEAVVVKNGRNVVYIVEGDKAVEKEVTTGLDTGDYVEILKGLGGQEKVIIKGQNYVDNGTLVKVAGGKKS